MTELLVLCTGNAARSVMAGFMLEHLKAVRPGTDLEIVTAGTHTIDGQPMGLRTRTALSTIPGLAGSNFSGHRSRQVHIRRRHPEAADRTASIRRLCADLPPAPPPLGDRVAALKLADVPLSDDDDVTDPAGHDADVYAGCALELWGLCQQLFTLL